MILKRLILVLICSLLPCIIWAQIEICDNGRDDDGDGRIDINDEDCFCQIINPISLIPNPSFEDRNCCPSERSQLDCASEWIQASEATTDYINTCDWLGWDDFPPPRPFPDGEGIMGFRDGRVRGNNDPEPYWKEYAGACLISPLLKDSTYRFQFDVGFVNRERSPAINISFFGTNSCEYLPFGAGNDAFGCPSNSPNWVKLAEVNVDGGSGNKWVNTLLEIVPDEDIYAIAIGPECRPISTPVSLYYFFDNLILADFKSFDLQIKEAEHPCNPDYTLSVADNPDFAYQWYLDGIALVGEAFSELTQNYGEGNYQVRIIDDNSCRLSTAFEYRKPIITEPARVSICEGESYDFGDLSISEPGIYLDTFSSIDLCDSIVTLDLVVIGDAYDTVSVSLYNGQSYRIEDFSFDVEGDYPLTLVSSLGCDSLVLLDLDYFKVYIPNVFGPELQPPNHTFQPYIAPGFAASIRMVIYDRWGNKIHEGPNWPGTDMPSGVYVYSMVIDFFEGEPETFVGNVTLLR